ncbi:MAG: DUF3990 domain-containing protein [Candidatus Melainabacteria bacterium]|jgi:hypothetical protein|nr:DUF3990 domain-containing protein [Candidatus Melainabacteria bacterium]
MKLVKAELPPWRNQDLTLFHGTLASHVGSIETKIDPGKMNPDADFGKGFYTTTNWIQARRWAELVSGRENGKPAVIEFLVRRDDLAKLDTLAFVLANRHSNDYWNLVESCRAYGESNRSLNRWYDLVVGPVCIRYQSKRAKRNYDQFSFHSEKGYKILNQGVVNTYEW